MIWTAIATFLGRWVTNFIDISTDVRDRYPACMLRTAPKQIWRITVLDTYGVPQSDFVTTISTAVPFRILYAKLYTLHSVDRSTYLRNEIILGGTIGIKCGSHQQLNAKTMAIVSLQNGVK